MKAFEDGNNAFLKPLLIPSQTTHTRLFPQKHSFSYSYFYVGVPVGWRTPVGSILSADHNGAIPWYRKTWFSVEAEDYLERGSHPDGLLGKLNDYLGALGIPQDDYAHALLVTAPRFLGFSFNPVSFWYLYDETKTLSAMILEVNNTFDERRMYFLPAATTQPTEGTTITKFKQEWKKDFHVSPFNDRSGAYSLSAIDPFRSTIASMHKVDNTIVLKSPEGRAKVVARVFSTEPAIDASKLSLLQSLAFTTRWWWVGFMTNPRILREARMLWVKKLQVFYRPEVSHTSIGRNESKEEQAIEDFFRMLLQSLVEENKTAFRYTPAAGKMRGKVVQLNPGGTTLDVNEKPWPSLEIRVLTPEFYSQLVRSTNLRSVFTKYCSTAAEGEAMLYCSDIPQLEQLLTKSTKSDQQSTTLLLRWQILASLRTDTLGQTVKLVLPNFACKKGPSSSEFDSFVTMTSFPGMTSSYWQTAITILLADRLAFGFPSILRLYRNILLIILIAPSIWLLWTYLKVYLA